MTDQMEHGSGDRFEVAVIGAGQAGLAMGYFLAKEGRHFTILEAADSIGSAWRSRWDSLVLFTPRRYDSLPGLPFPGDPDGYPGREEVIDYLEKLRVDLRAASPAEQRGPFGRTRRRRLRPRPRSADSPGQPGCGCDRPVPGPERACVRRGPRVGRRPDAQHGLPASERRSRRNRRGRRRRKHRIPDRQGAVGDPLGSPCDRISADTVAAAGARTRSLLVADEDEAHREDGRVAHRASCTGSRHADRLEHAGCEASRRRRSNRGSWASRAAQ